MCIYICATVQKFGVSKINKVIINKYVSQVTEQTFIMLQKIIYVCVCVLVYATLWGPNVPMHKDSKTEMFGIVGTGLRSPRGGKNSKNSKLCLSESVTVQTGFL